MFSVSDIYNRIKTFKEKLGAVNREQQQQLYFAKVDVQAAFDTIPQEAVVKLVACIPQQTRYAMRKHVEVQPLESNNGSGNGNGNNTSKRWHTVARAAGDGSTFTETLEATPTTAAKRNTVFVDGAAQKTHEARELLALTTAHVQQNLVKIGKKYYRQKSGIPQGSVLSSTLCNYFYADLERTHLGFLAGEDCLLLRLIDDFLLVTTSKRKARKFVEVMHRGVPEYGVAVSPGKSLVNFGLVVDGVVVPKLPRDEEGFPYCGLLIDTATLEVSKQRDRPKDPSTFLNPACK